MGGKNNKWKKESMMDSDKIEAMLDSGTTFTYLKSDVFSDMADNITEFCNIGENCGGGQNRTFNDDFCKTYEPSLHGDLQNFFGTFPKLYFKLKGGVT
jgi:hypothetical protein